VRKTEMVTKKTFLILVIFMIAAGCRTVSRMTGANTSVVKVRVSTDAADKNAAVEKSADIIRSKANALHIDVDVARSPAENDVLLVTFYDSKPSDPVKDILFKAHRLELKKAVENGHPPILFETAESASQTLKAGEEVLPISKVRDTNSPTFLEVESAPVITGDDIRSAHIFEVPDMDPSVMVTLKPDAAAKFKQWSSRNIENNLAIVLDGLILSYPVIKGEMSDSAMIEGRFTKEEANDLALDLNAGYLDGTMTIVDEK